MTYNINYNIITEQASFHKLPDHSWGQFLIIASLNVSLAQALELFHDIEVKPDTWFFHFRPPTAVKTLT